MLSFTRRSNCKFVGDSTVPAATLNTRPSLSFQTKALVPIPKTVTRRERYLTSLATDYLCRWTVCMTPTLEFDNDDAESDAFYAAINEATLVERTCLLTQDSVAKTDNKKVATDADDREEEGKVEEEEACYHMVTPSNTCKTAMLHDWRNDTVQKKYIVANKRPRISVHYAHPCGDHGRELLPLSSTEAEKHGAQVSAVKSDGAAAANFDPGYVSAQRQSSMHNDMFSELLKKHSSLCGGKSSDDIANRIEEKCEQRKAAIERQTREAQEKSDAEEIAKAKENSIACEKMIVRARALNPLLALRQQKLMSTGGGGYVAEQDSESVSECVGAAAATSEDSSDESATFSDEEPIGEQRHSRKAVGRGAALVLESDPDHQRCSREALALDPDHQRCSREALGLDPDHQRCSREAFGLDALDGDSGTNSCEDDDAIVADRAVETANKNNESKSKDVVETKEEKTEETESKKDDAEQTVVGKNDTDVTETKDEAEEEKKVEKKDVVEKRGHAIRQTSFEALIPVCNEDDGLAFFDKMDCPFLFQWAARDSDTSGARCKIHILRREKQTLSAYFGLSHTKRSQYHLIASIEIIVQD